MGELVDLLESSWETWVDLNAPFKRPEKGFHIGSGIYLNGIYLHDWLSIGGKIIV